VSWEERFAFRLAAHLGIADADRMLDSMPEGMLQRWMAFDRLEPLGIERLIGVIRRGLVAVARSFGAKVTEQQLDPALKGRGEAKAKLQTPQEQRAILRHVAAMSHQRR
jgi:hypothetical protein